jgi:hypothetical protein
MVKRKVIYGSIFSASSCNYFDDSVNEFISNIINNEECKIINYSTQVYGRNSDIDCIRTEIVYIETPTRKVLTEKENQDEPKKN